MLKKDHITTGALQLLLEMPTAPRKSLVEYMLFGKSGMVKKMSFKRAQTRIARKDCRERVRQRLRQTWTDNELGRR